MYPLAPPPATGRVQEKLIRMLSWLVTFCSLYELHYCKVFSSQAKMTLLDKMAFSGPHGPQRYPLLN